jgi:hypothetical protein
MYKALVEAYEGEYRSGLPGMLSSFHIDAYDFQDHFLEYELEYGEDVEPGNAIYVMDMAAQEIVVLILCRKIKHWDKDNILFLKYMREDLKRAMAGSLSYRDRDIDEVIKRESIPRAPFPHLIQETDIVAVDNCGRCLIPEMVENICTIDDLI